MKSDFILAFNEIAETRKLPKDVVLSALKAGLVSAYRRNEDVSSQQHVEVRIEEGQTMPAIWVEKEVVDDVQSEQTEVAITFARELYPDTQLGDLVLVDATPDGFGRIAAQTAKQVILQRMREAERDAQFDEFQERVGDIVTGTVQSDNGDVVTLALGRAEAILPRSQQVPGERHRMHDKVRAYVMEVRKTNRGPQIITSRTHRNMLRRLLEYEVPEIYNGQVEIKSIAREPGARSKVAVAALQPGADPVGACVGMRGVRIQSIVRELNGEKIDVIEWNPDSSEFISKALSPARVNGVFLDDDPDEGRTAIVVVPDDQLSLAIGREGQNARLAAKLTGWRIDIKSITEAAQEAMTHLKAESELGELAEVQGEMVTGMEEILAKKEASRVITPEDFQLMVDFVNVVEGYRLDLREDERAEKRLRRDAARAKVDPRAYAVPLSDTNLPLSVYNMISDAGYRTVGEVAEQYHLAAERFYYQVEGFEDSTLVAIEEMLNDVSYEDVELPVVEEAEEVVAEPTDAAADAEDTLEAVEDATGATTEDEPELEEEPVEAVAELETAEPEVDAAEPAADDGWIDEDDIGRARRAELIARMVQDGQLELDDEVAETVEQIVEESPVAQMPQQQYDEMVAKAEEEAADDYEDYDDDDYDDDLDDSEDQDSKRSKQRRRQLIFDEELGRVVAKRRRRKGRGGSSNWEEQYDDDLSSF